MRCALCILILSVYSVCCVMYMCIYAVQKFCLFTQVLLRELSSTKPWVSSHVSDHSGLHYRQFLLSQLCAEKGRVQSEMAVGVRDLASEEMKFVTDLIAFYPGHEALWYHRYMYDWR